MMRVVYLAAPYGGSELNRLNAIKWGSWILRTFDVAIIADWIWITMEWPESMRARGLEIDLALIARADEVWLVGGRVSAGMAIEASEAVKLGKPLLDLTSFGYPPPSSEEESLLIAIDERRRSSYARAEAYQQAFPDPEPLA